MRLKGFHIPLARGSEVTVYTMLPPVCRFNPFCPKAESERAANSRSQTQSNTGSVPDSDQLQCYRNLHPKKSPDFIVSTITAALSGAVSEKVDRTEHHKSTWGRRESLQEGDLKKE